MHLRTLVLRKVIPSVVTSMVASAALTAQSQGVIDCIPGGHGANCEVRLGAGQSSAVIRFRPTEPLTTSSPQKFHVQGGGILRTVTLASDTTGEFSWSRATPPTDTVLIFVQTADVPVVQVDTVRIFPAEAPARKVTLQNNLAPYVWLRNTWIPLPLRIGVAASDGRPLRREECEAVRFAIQAIPDGDVAPDTGRASHEEGARPYNCFVKARWKFADVTGRQDFGLRVGDEFIRIPGVAREGPRIVAGLAFFTRHLSEEERYCVGYAQDQAFDDCKSSRQSFADSIKRTRAVAQENVWQPFFAVESPVIFFLERQSTSVMGQWLQKHARIVAGSSFIKPGQNFFIGATLSPVVKTELESLPIQIQLAWRWNGGFVGGLSVDGSGLLSNALKALGAPF